MITRSKLVEQLRDYQIRSQHKWAALIFFSPKPHITNRELKCSTPRKCIRGDFSTFLLPWCCVSSKCKDHGILICTCGGVLMYTFTLPFQTIRAFRADVIVALLWALLFSVLVVTSYVTLYFKHFRFLVVVICFSILLPTFLHVSRQRRLARKRERRLLLPLSM